MTTPAEVQDEISRRVQKVLAEFECKPLDSAGITEAVRQSIQACLPEHDVAEAEMIDNVVHVRLTPANTIVVNFTIEKEGD